MRPRADTRAITVVELLPLVPAGVIALMSAFDGTVLVAAWVGTVIASFVFAMRDRAVLHSRGFGGLTTPLTALVHPILYIVLRGRACRGLDADAMAPLPWAIGATIAALIVLFVEWVFLAGLGSGIALFSGIG